jgi:glucosamine--fructose-6-phosphate aminotransferase (isomerizing)
VTIRTETKLGPTEQTIFEQFSYWQKAIEPLEPLPEAPITVFIGCGSSYNLSLSLAALANAKGKRAIAVPGGEWLSRPDNYWPDWRRSHVVALSRSGETTETVAAAKASRAAGAKVTAITCERDSSIARACDRLVAAGTHPVEGIVMTTSASLMLLLGLELLDYSVDRKAVDAAEAILKQADPQLPKFLAGRSHFVFLGGGVNYGVALEAALKLQEMSQIFSQGFHPLEYRHGPISLIDERSAAILLYGADTAAAEATLVGELQEKGAIVLGLGGPGDISLKVPVDPALAGLACLPALQLLGERAAQSRNIDTVTPRHLSKVVTLA